ncbi:MAG: DUF3685 domain-containing protein [Acaryochloridaceae cyanobacterium CSU_5_19]|nr:DUF3685 domain-containing protein [Acaryochloridaceae cyanobacterium CSU_5_19]
MNEFGRQPAKAQVQMVISAEQVLPVVSSQGLSAFTLLRQVFMETGLRQLEQNPWATTRPSPAIAANTLANLDQCRSYPRTPNRAVDDSSFLASPPMDRAVPKEVPRTAAAPPSFADWDLVELPRPARVTQVTDASALATVPGQEMTAVLIDALLTKLPTSLQNRTQVPLEVDILKSQKRQDLFVIVLKRFEIVLDELEASQLSRSQLLDKRLTILYDLWQTSTADFFGKYLTLPLSQATPKPEITEIELVKVLQQDHAIVETEILDKIPLVPELLEHLLFQTPLLVDNNLSAIGSPEAMLQAEALLSNLVVQVANAVMQPLLNRFATHEVIKQSFYDRSLLSTRDIERFRNALSARYRLRRWFIEPKEMFESQYSLVIFSEAGLQNIAIYTSRDHQLKTLSGLRLSVTLALEARDAIAPPLQATFTFLGRGVVYLLTQVVGRGIGLIGRGILQGIGGTWQELFITRKSPQQK